MISYKLLLVTLVFGIVIVSDCAIVPPPWSDPELNPCANLPGGWQLLYWPPLKQCFKIFTIGYPCPDTMELSPTVVRNTKREQKKRQNVRTLGVQAPAAECRCPPGTAISSITDKCHRIFEQGPCENGQYFSPVPENGLPQLQLQELNQKSKTPNNRLGSCRIPEKCPENMLFWPEDNKCYVQFTKGPCTKGNLLVLNEFGLAECKCENLGTLSEYFHAADETCHEHFTKGPCLAPGHLFLPGGECGCNQNLPHYHEANHMCFELNTIGPCPRGHVFKIHVNYDSVPSATHARCQCKEGYILWSDGNCYRLYTRGPCEQNEFLINATTCVHNFCGKNRLYFPKENTCYRIGSQGPCLAHQVVVFDFMARPSIDGISYNGVCGCSGVITNLNQQCTHPEEESLSSMVVNQCDSLQDAVEVNGQCFKLYSRGPCGPGQWLELIRTHISTLESDLTNSKRAKCVCRPGYTQSDATNHDHCNAPTVELASAYGHVQMCMSFHRNRNVDAQTKKAFYFIN